MNLQKIFNTLSEFLQSSQNEWASATSASRSDNVELVRREAYHHGEELMAFERYEEAIAEFKKAVGSSQYKKEAYYALAECYRQVHMLPLARKTYEQLMRLDYHYRDIQDKLRELETLETRQTPFHHPAEGQQAPAHAPTRQMPARDRYEMLSVLHESPRSRIYKVKDTLLDRVIALKQIAPDYPDRAGYLRRLKERIALEHPNVLRIYDIDEEQGQIAMEYVEGRDLRSILRVKGRLSNDIALYVAIQMVNGLHHAHTRGVIHQALLPEHLLLTRKCALKLIAFRAADVFFHPQQTTDPYTSLYIPPELFQQRELTPLSNIYSVGVIMYEMFTGRPPFSLQQLKAYRQQGAPLHYAETPLPAELLPLFRRCLAASPQDRHSSIRAVGEFLVHWHNQDKQAGRRDEQIAAYKDFLLMALADGHINEDEQAFLAAKRQEFQISEAEAQAAEADVKRELQQLLHSA